MSTRIHIFFVINMDQTNMSPNDDGTKIGMAYVYLKRAYEDV